MKLLRSLVFGAIFAATIALGFRAGSRVNWLDWMFRHSLRAAPDKNRPARRTQVNWLIIGVDESRPAGEQLESVWLAIRNDTAHTLTFIPIFPDLHNPERNFELAAAFRLYDGVPPDSFWAALETSRPIWWDGYIITSRAEAVKIINTIGGINVTESAHAEGQPGSTAQGAHLAEQQAVLQAICQRLQETSPWEKTKAAWQLVLNAPLKQLPMFLQSAAITITFRDQEDFTCVFPTPIAPLSETSVP